MKRAAAKPTAKDLRENAELVSAMADHEIDASKLWQVYHYLQSYAGRYDAQSYVDACRMYLDENN